MAQGDDVRLDYESTPPPDGPWNFFLAIGVCFLAVAAGVGVLVWLFRTFLNPAT